MNIQHGCVYTVEEPAQTFCSCGQPIKVYYVPSGHVALPIKWIENGCASCEVKLAMNKPVKILLDIEHV